MFDRSKENARRARLRLIGGAIASLVILAASLSPLAAQGERLDADRARALLVENFEVLPLSDGLALAPRDDVGFRILEIRGNEVAIDGTAVALDELRARLDERALPILWLLEQSPEDRALWLGESGGSSAVDAAMEGETPATAAPPPPPPPPPPGERRRPRDGREVSRLDPQVVVGSSVTVEENEVARDVLVVGGSLVVRGRVKGDAVAIGGSIEIEGEVTGDVAAIGGSVDLEEMSRVEGDVVAVGGSVSRDPGAVVEGEVQEVSMFPNILFPKLRLKGAGGPGRLVEHRHVDVDVSPVDTAFRLAWSLFGIGLLLVLALLTLLIARSPVERIGERAEQEPFKAGLVGLLCQILFFPLLILVVLVLVISIVGIPFLLLIPFVLVGLLLVGLMGYAAVTLKLGRWTEGRFGWSLSSPFVALVVGVALVHVWSLIGDLLAAGPGPIKFFAVMFSLFGGLVVYAAWTVGFGAAVLSRFGTQGGWSGGAVPVERWQPPPQGPSAEAEPAYEEDAWPPEDDGGRPPGGG
jgi:cytoskeletal protein CcmA (bactofilin family)